jgi:hypothetical protein
MNVKEWWYLFTHNWTITRAVRWSFLITLIAISSIYIFIPELLDFLIIKIILVLNFFGIASLAYIMGWALGINHGDKNNEKL